MKRRGRKPSPSPEDNNVSTTVSLPKRKFKNYRENCKALKDDPNRLFERTMDTEEAITRGLTGIRARRALIGVETERLRLEDERLASIESSLAEYDANTTRRHELPGYDERTLRVAEDIRDDPSLEQYLPERAGVISREFKVEVDAVIEDIKEELKRIV